MTETPAPSWETLPDRLTAALGIEPAYDDIWGNRRETGRETAAALATALGIDAATPATVEAGLLARENAGWRRLLPPVITLTEGDNITVPLSMPAGARGEVMWIVWPEQGAERYESGLVSMLPLRATREIDGVRYIRRELDLGHSLPAGYHRLSVSIEDGGLGDETVVIVAPPACLSAQDVLDGARVWGLATQLYGVRSAGNWGMGDFSDLGALAEQAAALGADLIGLNPLHALFSADPGHCSPYSPSSRSLLNIFYIDVTAVPEYADCTEARRRVADPAFLKALAAARRSEFVDYPAVAALKLPILEALHAHFADLAGYDLTNDRNEAFRAFTHEMGEELQRHALFEALHESFLARDPELWHWTRWPEPFRDAGSREVADFAKANAERIAFFTWLQWEADRQLGQAAARARDAGMRIGFYRDLAVGADSGGSAAWSDPQALANGAAVGAPPDLLNLKGQNWGLKPLSPLALFERAYAPFISAVRANMRHAGALRIDHVMGLMHAFWLPDNGAAGAYVSYPLADLLRIVALESHRNRCLVIGEDLGTVPDGFRPRMAEAGILSYRVLYFERDKASGDFLPPDAYPAESLAALTTHDLPGLRGFWDNRDIDWRRRLDLYPDAAMVEKDEWDRGVDRWRLLRTLESAGLRPASYPDNEGRQPWRSELTAAVYRYLAATPSAILMVAMEDALDDDQQPNLPGTVDQHPNWRRRWSIWVEEMAAHRGVNRLAAACRRPD